MDGSAAPASSITHATALRSVDSFEQRSSLRTWLFSILRRRIADSFRRKRSFAPLEDERHALESDSPEEALEVVKAWPIDLVVSDVEMPGINGFELTRQLRQMERYAEVPVIIGGPPSPSGR